MNSDKTLSTIEIIAIASDKNRPISERATAARSLIGIASERAYCTVERFAQQCGMSRQQLYRLANIYNFAVLLDISWDWIDSIGIAKTAYIMQLHKQHTLSMSQLYDLFEFAQEHTLVELKEFAQAMLNNSSESNDLKALMEKHSDLIIQKTQLEQQLIGLNKQISELQKRINSMVKSAT